MFPMLTATLAAAHRLELEHVTVHFSDWAVPFYQRLGFQHDQRWLEWWPK